MTRVIDYPVRIDGDGSLLSPGYHDYLFAEAAASQGSFDLLLPAGRGHAGKERQFDFVDDQDVRKGEEGYGVADRRRGVEQW